MGDDSMALNRQTRNRKSQYPHRVIVRITDRQFINLQEIQRLTPNNPPISNMIRDSLSLWIAQRLYSLDNQK